MLDLCSNTKLPFLSESRHFYPLIGQEIHYFETLPSTQDLALSWAKERQVKSGSVIRAGHQTAGRGQANNTWQDEGGLNIACSVIYFPEFTLLPVQTFYLSKWVSLAVLDTLKPLLPEGLVIKWPNDIWYHERKLAGILIQTSISGTAVLSAVVGIGININQQQFGNLIRATSVKELTGEHHDLEAVMRELLSNLNRWLSVLEAGELERLDEAYLNCLLGLHQSRSFRLPDGQIIRGQVTGIDEHGRLQIVYNNSVHHFGFKEIEWLIQ